MDKKDLNLKMKDIARKIKDKRIELGLSLQDLADLTGMSKSTLQRYETGYIRNIPIDKFELLAKALRSDPLDFLEWDIAAAPLPSLRLPVLGTVSCGTPLKTEEESDEYFDLQQDIDADFCVYASGESMTGVNIQNGDLLFIKKLDGERPENGDIVIACIDGETLLKRVFAYGDEVFLHAENNDFEPIRVDVSEDSGTELLIQGKLTYVLHKQ